MEANQGEAAGATTGVSGDQTFRAPSGLEDGFFYWSGLEGGHELGISMIWMNRIGSRWIVKGLSG